MLEVAEIHPAIKGKFSIVDPLCVGQHHNRQQRGENGGITLPHKNVVKQLVPLGTWSGAPASFVLPKSNQAGLREAVLVQKGPGGVIVAAARD